MPGERLHCRGDLRQGFLGFSLAGREGDQRADGVVGDRLLGVEIGGVDMPAAQDVDQQLVSGVAM